MPADLNPRHFELTSDGVELSGEELRARCASPVFREGVVMTRFFSEVVLEDGGGTLEPLREHAEEAVAPEA